MGDPENWLPEENVFPLGPGGQLRPLIKAPPGLTGYVEPGLGKGLLRFYPYIGYPDQGWLEFSLFSRQPWNNTGWQPFAWDLLRPVGKHTLPVLRLVLGRSVRFTTKVNPLRGYSHMQALPFGPRSPDIQIFRPQDDSLIPQPGEEIETFRFLPAPFRVGPEGFWEGGQDWSPEEHSWYPPESPYVPYTFNVISYPLGVEICRWDGTYRVTISVNDVNGGAYAYELDLSGLKSGTITKPPKLRIMYSGGVTVKAEGVWEDVPLDVEAARMPSMDFVLPQGASLEEWDSYLSPVKIDYGPEQRPLWSFLLELAIGFVPYVGPLYLASEFAYTAITGKDFYGYHVSDGELWMMGITAVLPIALSKSLGALAALRTELRTSPLARALDEGVTREIQRVMETEFLEAVGKIDPKDAAQIGRLLTKFVSRQISPAEILQAFDKLIRKNYLIEIDKRLARQAITADYRNFRNANLASGFNQYATRKGTRSVIEWALAQRTGRYVAELERELGPNWRRILQRSRNDSLLNPNPLSAKEIAHYDRLAVRIEDYSTLAKENAGHGDFFEVDHICEQRFWRNDPRITSAFDEKGLGMTMLVPKNPAVAVRMPGKTIAYVHTTKTQMLADLIPNGRETEFAVQQVWDAHSFTLQALKVDRSVILGERVTDNFSMLARARGEPPVDFRIVTGDRFDFFFSPPRWPRFPGSGP
jgi:hypothetical protein